MTVPSHKWKIEGPFRRFSSQQIGKKVRYLFLSIVALYLVFFLVIYTLFIQNNMSEYAAQKNLNTLTSIETNLTTEAERMSDMSILVMTNDSVIKYLTGGAGYQDIESKEVVNTLYDLMNVFEGVSSIYIFRPSGSYVCATRNMTNAFPSVMDAYEWKQALLDRAGGYTITLNGNGLFKQKKSGDVISFMRVVNDLNTQKPIGFLAVNLPVTFLEQTYEDHIEGDSHFCYLYNDRYLYGEDLTDEYESIASDKAQYRNKMVGTWGDEKIVSYYRITGTPLTIVSVESFYSGEIISSEMAVLLIMLVALTVASVALISAFISFYITKPIKSLVHSMDSVAKTGGLHKARIVLPDDEIGHLKNRYNMMLDEIDTLFKELVTKEKKIRNAELSALQEQIKPHFLYNTLDTLAYMASEEKAPEVYEAIQTLASFFTSFLSNGSSEVPVHTELQIVRDYLKLQKYRYGDIFNDEYEVDESLLDIRIPKLILQPLVENALYHGVRPKGEKCIIRITIYEKDGDLHIIVYDSGVGMSPERIQQMRQREDSDGFGFTGTIDRIRYFSDRDDVFSIRSVEGEYTEIELVIPITIKEKE